MAARFTLAGQWKQPRHLPVARGAERIGSRFRGEEVPPAHKQGGGGGFRDTSREPDSVHALWKCHQISRHRGVSEPCGQLPRLRGERGDEALAHSGGRAAPSESVPLDDEVLELSLTSLRPG